MLDGIRGLALLLMLISHSMQLFPGEFAYKFEWRIVRGIVLLTKAATPLFVWIFGMTMAFVYLNTLNGKNRSWEIKRKLWKRAVLVFLSYELLIIIVELSQGSTLERVISRMLYLNYGHWVEVLNFYVVFLIVGPWILIAWKRTLSYFRIIFVLGIVTFGLLLSRVPVSSSLFAIKNVFVSYSASLTFGIPPDSFPVFQLSIFFFGGLWYGERLLTTLQTGNYSKLFAAGLSGSVLSMIASMLFSGDGVMLYISNIAHDLYRFPPTLPYIFFGLSVVQGVTILIMWIYTTFNKIRSYTKGIELLGRNSLLTFNIQYIVLFGVYGYVFQYHRSLNFLELLIHTFSTVLVCIVVAWLREKYFPRKSRPVTIKPEASLP